MKAMRQIEAAELMQTVSNFSSSYAKALLAATKQADLAKPDRPKKVSGMSAEQMARMEREMETLHRDFKAVEASYGEHVLHLVIGYLARLVANRKVEKYLLQNSPEILEKLRAIISSASLDGQSQETAVA